MTAEQAFPAINAIIQQVRDSSEKQKLETKILGAVESFEKKKAGIHAMLDKRGKYQIRSPRKSKSK